MDENEALAALRRSEERFRTLVDSIEDIVFTLDREQRFTGLFGRWMRKMGYEPESFLGKTAREALGIEDAAAHEAANERALAGEHVVYEWQAPILPVSNVSGQAPIQPGERNVSGQAKSANGSSFFQIALSPMYDANCDIVGIVGVGREITGIKKAEEALRNALERARQHRAETVALLQSARAVLEFQDFKDTARSIIDSCKDLTGATVGFIALLSYHGTQGEIAHLDLGGHDCAVDPSLQMTVRRFMEQAVPGEEPVYDNHFSNSEWAMLIPPGHVTLDNVLFVPLVIKREVLGLLGLANKPGGFTENDARIAAALGELAAIALNNSRTKEALESSEERFRSVAQTACDAIIALDSKGDVAFWNHAAEMTFGYLADEMIGRPLALIIPERFRADHIKGLERVVATGKSKIIGKTAEFAGLRRDGSEFPIEISLASWKTKGAVFFTGIVRDITERKRLEQELAHLATHDPLTGLPNRRSLEEAIARAAARARRGTPSSLLFLDLDNFKLINDTLGHTTGDGALITLARLLQEQLRAEDLLIRLGGDEFAALLEGTDAENAVIVAERMRSAVKEFCCTIDGVTFDLSVSIGLVAIDGDEPPSVLLSRADAAMYKAKYQGRNRVVLDRREEDRREEDHMEEGIVL